jgi:hypothetical protein
MALSRNTCSYCSSPRERSQVAIFMSRSLESWTFSMIAVYCQLQSIARRTDNSTFCSGPTLPGLDVCLQHLRSRHTKRGRFAIRVKSGHKPNKRSRRSSCWCKFNRRSSPRRPATTRCFGRTVSHAAEGAHERLAASPGCDAVRRGLGEASPACVCGPRLWRDRWQLAIALPVDPRTEPTASSAFGTDAASGSG